MTKEEKNNKQLLVGMEIAALRAKLEMLEDEKRALEATPVNQVWEPKKDDSFWFSGRIYEVDFTGPEQKHMVSCGLAHPTKEAAERHHAFLVMLHDLHKFAVTENEGWKRDFFNDVDKNWFIMRNEKGELRTDYNNFWDVTPLPVFKSEEIASKAIDTFGDRLKILFEYYNS